MRVSKNYWKVASCPELRLFEFACESADRPPVSAEAEPAPRARVCRRLRRAVMMIMASGTRAIPAVRQSAGSRAVCCRTARAGACCGGLAQGVAPRKEQREIMAPVGLSWSVQLRCSLQSRRPVAWEQRFWGRALARTLCESVSERLDNDPSGARYGCFLPDLTGLARRLPAPTSRGVI